MQTTKQSAFPMTAEQFLAKAEPIMVKVGGTTLEAKPRQFASSSLGYYCFGKTSEAGKVEVLGSSIDTAERTFSTGSIGMGLSAKVEHKVAGKAVTLQVSGNLVKIGSKPGSKPGASAGQFQVSINLVCVNSKHQA